MIAIIDYGAGNLRSVQKAVEHLGAAACLTRDPAKILGAGRVILPGVGAFGHASAAIDRLALRETLLELFRRETPFLGICLGMQLLFSSSEESPGAIGLARCAGSVRRFAAGLKVPHLGWNSVAQPAASPLWRGIPDGAMFYFAHSYYIDPAAADQVIGTTEYGGMVPVAIQSGALAGVQFHPEKSQRHGLRLLQNFITL